MGTTSEHAGEELQKERTTTAASLQDLRRRSAMEPAASTTSGEVPPGTVPDDALLLTVIVPAYNEASTIDALLNRVVAAPYDKQVIVVDDGSTDDTAEVLARWESHPQIELLRHGKNRGKGAAIRTALERACGRFTIIQDANLEYNPEDYPLLIEPLLSGKAQVVYGSRALNRELERTWCLFRVGVEALNFAVRLLYGVRVTDEATCYKAFPTAVLRRMELACERFEFCPEVTAKAVRLGLRITEVPIRYEPRSAAEGKKIRWTDGMQVFAALWRWRKWRPRAAATADAPKCAAGSDAGGPAHGADCWLSVILPTYNGAAHLPATLDSLVCQGSRNFEVIAVDDGSTDGTVEILRSYASQLSLKIISRRHGGNWITNTNMGMEAAAGRYLCILHQDDTWAPERVQELRRLLARRPEARLVLHPAWFIDFRGKRVGLWRCPLKHRPGYLRRKDVLERLLVQDFLAASAPVFRKETAAKVGWMDEGLWYTGDWDFWLKLARRGRTLYCSSPLVSFRIHPLSQTSLGADGSEEIRRQYATVLSRHLSRWPWSRPDFGRLSRIAWFSAELNLALMRKTTGQSVNWGRLCSHFLQLGMGGWRRYFRDSRILDRGLSRLRVGLARPDARDADTLPRSTVEEVDARGSGGPVLEKGRLSSPR